MATERRILRDGHYAANYALVVRQLEDDKETLLQFRRVKPAGGNEELQIEISITKFGDKRRSTAYSSFVMPADIADEITEACKTLRLKKAE